MFVFRFSFTVIFSLILSVIGAYFIENVGPEDCTTSTDDEYHEYFDISQLQCLKCSQPALVQTATIDGLRCTCQPGYRLTKDFGGGEITCEPCPANQVTSASGWECISCSNSVNAITAECQPCKHGFITVERDLQGVWTQSRECLTCDSYTTPNVLGNRCNRCTQVLSMLPKQFLCNCPTNQQAGGVCFSSSTDLTDDSAELYRVSFGDEEFGSGFLYQNVRAAHAMCLPKYGNLTACQMLGNMCVMIQYSGGFNDACALYKELAGIQERYSVIPVSTAMLLNRVYRRSNTRIGPINMPWLYYYQAGDDVLDDDDLTATFTFPDDKLEFVLAKYSADGDFLGMQDASNGALQLCKNQQSILDAAYNFGTTYNQGCELNVAALFEVSYETVFYDMFLKFQKDGKDSLYPVPVLLLNEGQNAGDDRSEWNMVRRFFLVDNLSGKEYTSVSGPDELTGQFSTTRTFAAQAKAIRYAASMHIHVELKKDETDGSVIPPYLAITYATASSSDRDNNNNVQIDFRVSYAMHLEKYNQDMQIATGVLSALAIVYATVQSWGWNKREGKVAIGFPTILTFVIFLVGNLCNVFFLVAFGSSIWWFIFYKLQNSVYLIVPETSTSFVTYVSMAFVFALLKVAYMIFKQTEVDVFLIDWERPKGQGRTGEGESAVSIWRTYFVANEWNELQTIRKLNFVFQIFAVIAILYAAGFENYAVMSPVSKLSYDSNTYQAPYSPIFRFAIGGLVYIIVALGQWLFHTFIYERFFEDPVRLFTDLSSLANISVLILENELFGYYIHGRSAHGRADTNIRQMHEDFKREEDSLCGKRGLLPNTDQQTFEMAVPRRMREQYNRVMMPILQRQQGAAQAQPMNRGGGPNSHLDAHTERCISAYNIINRFFQSFIDHSLKDIDYTIEDKMLLESMLKLEFKGVSDKGFLYNDSGHSFDQILFYGNETTLVIFDLLLFSIADYVLTNYTTAAIITYVVGTLLARIRNSRGRKNLAAKTLVDDRFLI